MSSFIEKYRKSNPKTKNFILTCVIYGLVIILTTIYCYARLDFVRSNNKVQKEPDNRGEQLRPTGSI